MGTELVKGPENEKIKELKSIEGEVPTAHVGILRCWTRKKYEIERDYDRKKSQVENTRRRGLELHLETKTDEWISKKGKWKEKKSS